MVALLLCILLMPLSSSITRVVIPEIGAEIEPGEISDGEVTTVEGVVTRIWERMYSAFHRQCLSSSV